MHQPAGKETLAQWVSLALRKALSPKNIKNGFASTGIIPLNHSAVDGQFAPSRPFEATADEGGIVAESPLDGIACEEGTGGDPVAREGTPTTNEVSSPTRSAFEDDTRTQVDQVPETNEKGNSHDMEATHIETEMAEEPNSQAEHFFVDCDRNDQGLAEEIAGLDPAIEEVDSMTRFLTLPTVTKRSKPKFRDPILDFTKSHILTSEEFTNAMQRWKESRENAAKEKERKAAEREEQRNEKLLRGRNLE
jgi:hypothetical protein